MHSFTERMRSFADAVLESRQMRSEAVAGIKEAAEEVRDNARAFLHRLGDEHRAMAEHTRSTLAADRRDRFAEVEHFRTEVRRGQAEASRMLHQRLGQARQARHEHMGRLMHAFAECRQHLADDLHEAARAWQRVAQGRATKK